MISFSQNLHEGHSYDRHLLTEKRNHAAASLAVFHKGCVKYCFVFPRRVSFSDKNAKSCLESKRVRCDTDVRETHILEFRLQHLCLVFVGNVRRKTGEASSIHLRHYSQLFKRKNAFL